MWLEKVFDPQSHARNKSGRPRLLILDGHNSHFTYHFSDYAEKHNIIIVCLPSHTTHALQPCDVGVFSPLAAFWRAEVNEAARNNIPITKHNFLEFYHRARVQAFKPATIQAAFAKTGIWPLNRDAIDPVLYAPATNTTTKSAQPIPATIPSILVPIPDISPASSASAERCQGDTVYGFSGKYLCFSDCTNRPTYDVR